MLRAKDVRTFVSHASLSASERRQAEAAFVEEKDQAIVATSTLELGIDVGDLDRVIQIDSPSSVSSSCSAWVARVGGQGSLRNCLFLTTNQDAFLLALGVTHLWSQAWVEATSPSRRALADRGTTDSRGHAGAWRGFTSEVVSLLARCFPELPLEASRRSWATWSIKAIWTWMKVWCASARRRSASLAAAITEICWPSAALSS